MAGQQQLKVLNAEKLYNEALDTMLNQADLKYFNDKFKVGSNFDELKMLHAYLYQDTLCTDNCDLLKWIQKKIAGKLGLEDIKIVDLKTLQTKRPDIYITNIYNTEQNWSESLW